jgi:hypothetical protein
MLKYKIYKIDNDIRVSVEEPYSYLGYFSISKSWLSTEIQQLIDEITKVKNGEIKDYYFGNDTGFSAVAAQANPDDETEGEEGVYVYDGFGKEPETALFVIPLDDMLNLLKEFKEFLVENKR